MTRRVRAPQRGQPITARFLGTLAANQNENLEYVRAPRDLNGGKGTAGEVNQSDRGKRGKRGEQGEPGVGLLPFENWRELTRSTTTVRITNESDSSVYVDVERIDRISFLRSGGGVVTLVLDND